MVKLTNDNVRTLPVKGADVLYPDDETPNFYLRVREGGSRTFIIQWRQGQFQRRSTVGKIGIYTVDEARKKARQLLVGIDNGTDPIARKAQARVDDRQLFGVLAAEYIDLRARDLRARSLEQCKLHLLKYFVPLHRLPLHKINRATVAAELRAVSKERGPVAANRGRSTLSVFFGWAIGEGIIEANPVLNTNKTSEGMGRERVLTDDELTAVWSAAPASDFGRIVRLLLLTSQRRTEIASLRWDEIVDGTITLSRERTKNGRAHVVPLSPQALAVLESAPRRVGRELVFGEGKGGFSGFAAAKKRLDEASGVTDWTLHDLRRTTATKMADLAVLPHVIEAVLNHTSGFRSGVSGIYNRSAYTEEKRAAMLLWGNHVRILLAKAKGTNVTMLRKPALGGVA
jgi:integrase